MSKLRALGRKIKESTWVRVFLNFLGLVIAWTAFLIAGFVFAQYMAMAVGPVYGPYVATAIMIGVMYSPILWSAYKTESSSILAREAEDANRRLSKVHVEPNPA